RVAHLLRTLYDSRRNKGYLDQVRLAAADSSASDAAILAALRAGEASRDFFDSWAHLIESKRLGTGRVREAGLVEDVLTPAMRDLALRLKALKELVSVEAD